MKERQSQPAPVDDNSTVNRRTVLYGAAAGGLAVALVGCGSDEPAGDATSSPTPQEPAEASSEPQEQTSKPENANVLTETSEVPVNGGVIIDDEVVVTQPSEGTFKAFSAICTHQGCVVSDVANGIISCPCHGSQYSATDGSVEAGPAPSPLPEVAIDVKAGEVVRA